MEHALVLTGPRVALRAPRLDDADELFDKIASDPEVTRFLSWMTHPAVDETRRVILELFNVGDDRTLVIELRDTGEVIGLCGWERTQPHAIYIGYCLARPWWGQGIMTEVVGLVMDEIQRDPTVYRVWSMCHVDNRASARVLEHGGLVLEGRLVRHSVFPNISAEPQDVQIFGKAVR